MTSAADFYYTVQAYEYSDISPITYSVSAAGSNSTASGGRETVDFYYSNEWVLIPSDGKQVNTRNTVQYRIRVYKRTPQQGNQLAINFLGDNEEGGVNVTATANANFKGKITGIKQEPERNVGGGSGTVFWFNVTSDVQTTAKPVISVKVGSSTPLPADAVNYDRKGKVPAVNFTVAATKPTKPFKLIIDAMFPGTTWAVPSPPLAGTRTSYYDYSEKPNVPDYQYNIVYDACKKQWLALKILFTQVAGYPAGTASSWILYRFDTAGTLVGSPVKQPSEKYAKQLLLKANSANCEEPVAPTPEPPEGGLTIPSTDSITYNPPAHYVSRGISHGIRVADYETAMRENKSIVIDTFKANSVFSQFVDSRNNLGRIFQSQGAAESMNVATQTKGKVPIFGFKFMYNPQSINYSIPMNTSIDWTLSTQDPANLIAGNIAVNFTLYLNRIADMTELMPLKAAPTLHSRNYPRQLSKEEVEGILLRGTEYDLEFLYRSVNGNRDMKGNSLLTYDGESADKGYITGVPLWFVLHDNMRYYGSLQNISVDHVVFTDKMVPMLSVVSISFLRYPSGAAVDEFLKAKNKEDAAIPEVDPNASKTASTGTTTP
jgi:hypothetical protein